MTKIGIGLPGQSIADVRAAAEAAAPYDFDSFSVYGDLGDLPPYAVLHATADILRGSRIPHVGPMGVPVGMQHPEVIAAHVRGLDEQLPGQSYVGLVRGAFLESIGERPASLAKLESTAKMLQDRYEHVPIYLGGFGEQLLGMAGRLAVAGVKLGGSTNPELARRAKSIIGSPDIKLVMGAVSVIDKDRVAARARARREVAKYLEVVGPLDPTLEPDEAESLSRFLQFSKGGFGIRDASGAISDALLDKFAIAGTPEDAQAILEKMDGIVDRFEFGTPHGLHGRARAIRLIGQSLLDRAPEQVVTAEVAYRDTPSTGRRTTF